MSSKANDPLLFTPGPLTTSYETKTAMLHDWGSRDTTFLKMDGRVREQLLRIVNAVDSHVCIPLQGSGTFAVEAAIGTLLPRNGKALILINGAYGHRIAKIISYIERSYTIIETPENECVSMQELEATLIKDPNITHVVAVHCETTSGILNPIEAIAETTAQHNRKLIIDAMSAFGAISLDAKSVTFEALIASSNKCLEGVPGMAFAIIQREAIKAAANNAHSLSLDLHDQWKALEASNQWRFTPPTHVIVALHTAINEFESEGGVKGRGSRYRTNATTLVTGMRKLGFETLLPDNLQAPIIVTFYMPADPNFEFSRFYDMLKNRGFVIYPGKLTKSPSFRIGCIGRLGKTEILTMLDAVKHVMSDMEVLSGKPTS
ncbi:MAG: 2-aminoethylphosphonate--pyruvate transaminase [Rhodospirillaceae bacterium TMED8]|nr:2-aminoethylphosphonate--pyruvate transaminase [Magnetovibrio sp.]OUT50823.1 MAG: 2-aminoethylphosphonate--pyruvate transaminase [Rhodospirillaceae bacterium TMED8]|tara:strand:- start:2548 stop:3675 length:1128 start_codon:yes stop_codon:yes gene_type:complete